MTAQGICRVRDLNSGSVFGALSLALAYGLKRHFSTASASELDWILRPTAALVGWMLGARFDAQSTSGYVSGELGIVIAPVCSGVNYLIVAFCTLMFGFMGATKTVSGKALWLLFSAAAAYAATVLVNAARIASGIILRQATWPTTFLSPDQVHRLNGVAIYLISLWLVFHAVERARTSFA